jgi:hypothetical protein
MTIFRCNGLEPGNFAEPERESSLKMKRSAGRVAAMPQKRVRPVAAAARAAARTPASYRWNFRYYCVNND